MQGRSLAISNALESRADAMTSYVDDGTTTQAWPFVTLPHFEVQGENTRRETRTEVFAFAPLLTTDADKEGWNTNYSVDQETWLKTSYARAIRSGGGPSTEAGQAYAAALAASPQKGIPESVYRVEGDFPVFSAENSPGPWLPLWQISPPPLDPYPVNFNLLSSPDVAQMVEYVQEHQVPVMTDRLVRDPLIRHWIDQYDAVTPAHNHALDHDYDPDVDHITHDHDDNNRRRRRRRRRLDHDGMNAYSDSYSNAKGDTFVVYPIFNTFADNNDDTNNSINDNINGTTTRQMTGIYLSLLRWDWMLTDALHLGTEPVVVVLKNTCGEDMYTYLVQGMDAIFVGLGDGHDDHYDSDEIISPVKHLHGVTEPGGDTCDFFLHVYPTKEFRVSFTSDQAIVFTTIVGLAFGITALFFFYYVRIVQRRQSKVMATAARTNAIVTSLFPSNVRDRIMKDAEDAVNNNKEMVAPFLPGMGDAPKKKLKSFLDEENPAASNDTQLIMFKTKPIADLFPETTVMFADLVGFTAWSSVREPTQVFQLLETIYHSTSSCQQQQQQQQQHRSTGAVLYCSRTT